MSEIAIPKGGFLLSMSTCSVIARTLAEELRGPAPSPFATFNTAVILEGGFLAPQAAADYLGVTRKRVHDLTSMGALVPDGRDGRTPLFKRDTLDSYVRG